MNSINSAHALKCMHTYPSFNLTSTNAHSPKTPTQQHTHSQCIDETYSQCPITHVGFFSFDMQPFSVLCSYEVYNKIKGEYGTQYVEGTNELSFLYMGVRCVGFALSFTRRLGGSSSVYHRWNESRIVLVMFLTKWLISLL